MGSIIAVPRIVIQAVANSGGYRRRANQGGGDARGRPAADGLRQEHPPQDGREHRGSGDDQAHVDRGRVLKRRVLDPEVRGDGDQGQ